MSTFIPAIPLLTADDSTTKLAKTVVETSPGVFALNTVGGGGGSQIPIIKFNKFNGTLLSEFKKSYGIYYYPNSSAYTSYIEILNKELNIISLNAAKTSSFTLENGSALVYRQRNYDSSLVTITLPFNYQPVGLPE